MAYLRIADAKAAARPVVDQLRKTASTILKEERSMARADATFDVFLSHSSEDGDTILAGCGKTRFEADAVPRNSLVSTAQPDKKKACVEKTSSSWMCLAT